MEILDSSRLSSSGSGPKSNVSKSGRRSSRSRSFFGAYGWSNLIEVTVHDQRVRRVCAQLTRQNLLSSSRGAKSDDSYVPTSSEVAVCFHT